MATKEYRHNNFRIILDLCRDKLFDAHGLARLRDGYMRPEEVSPQERLGYVSCQFASDEKHAQRLYDYASKHWLSYATPILSFGKSKHGLPISCFLSYIPDTAAGLVDTLSEVSWLSMIGGGVGIGVGIRASDDKSTGVMPHMRTYNAHSLAFRQGKTRRGTYAPFLDLDHPDIKMFIEMRKKTGDFNIRCRELHHGVNIPDRFMEIIERCMKDENANDDWDLIDPASGRVFETVSAKELWAQLLTLRMEEGEPYLHFIDASNRKLPAEQKALGLKVRQSNICTEIIRPTDDERTAVCALSSLNFDYYDEWSTNDVQYQFIRDVMEMIDNCLEYFIQNAPKEVSRAVYAASRERPLGIGALGIHSYLQSKNIPFESPMAIGFMHKAFSRLELFQNEINLVLGSERGPCPDMAESGKRFAVTSAIAPNASSSVIMGNTSASAEPWPANVYRQDTLSGFKINKNKHLAKIIKAKCEEDKRLDEDEIWTDILANEGSIQHLTELFDENTRAVFKTAFEIDQRYIIEHAAARDNYIDQAQSTNLFFKHNASIPYIHAVHFMAWKKGLPTLYYCRSTKASNADKIGKRIERVIIEEEPAIDMAKLVNEDTCTACEG